ncbi:MAG: hypothetical protein M9887_09150 [Chitinophagales bacterium]|nr:hypothetical protein [Chitinophagales bacterium]
MKDSIPSHDTVEYAFQKLKVPNKIVVTENNTTHQINYNKNINSLLAGICVNLGLLKPDVKDCPVLKSLVVFSSFYMFFCYKMCKPISGQYRKIVSLMLPLRLLG